jgi:hypothetical protein
MVCVMSDSIPGLEVRDSRGKLIEHLASEVEEDCESNSGVRQLPAKRTPGVEPPTSGWPTPEQTHPDVKIVGRARSSERGTAAHGRASKIELPEGRGEPVGMSKDVFKLLEELEEHVQGCRRVPMTDKVLVGEETLLDYIDQIRSLLPEQLRQARLMVMDREHLMDDARVDVERVLSDANQRIESMISESEVVKRAEDAAEEIVAQSRRVAFEIKNNAARYADDIMSSLEANLGQNLAMIRSGREELSQLKRERQTAVNG